MLGRDHRRGVRPALQIGALPWRLAADGSIEVLLVTSRGTGRWIVPKGWPMRGKTNEQAAAIEAWEEGGVRGIVSGSALGSFTYLKARFLLRPLLCEVTVYPLLVEEELDDWPERGQRRRKWYRLERAAVAVRSKQIAHLIRVLSAGRRAPARAGAQAQSPNHRAR